ncbi:hypothetical protein, partial [Thiolapillus sp.]|uniref:hypothetical protein n=1 Tax=Thiolapillus sp. TaxID=2017437 RepID=UPI003AF45939
MRTTGKQCGLAATGDYQPSLRSPWLVAIDLRPVLGVVPVDMQGCREGIHEAHQKLPFQAHQPVAGAE